jgi:hypothetical protein
MDRKEPEYYEPFPDLSALPGWLWRKTGRRARVALGLVSIGAIVAAVLLAPGIGESKRGREADQERARAERHARLIRAQRIEQTPHHRETRYVDPGRGDASARFAARVRLVANMRSAILADARRRERAGELDGPLRRVECERFPRTVGGVRPQRDLSKARARYACLAVTSQFGGGVIGHPYRSKVAFRDGAYTFCKIAGRPGVERDPEVTTPRVCGG